MLIPCDGHRNFNEQLLINFTKQPYKYGKPHEIEGIYGMYMYIIYSIGQKNCKNTVVQLRFHYVGSLTALRLTAILIHIMSDVTSTYVITCANVFTRERTVQPPVLQAEIVYND